MVGGPLSNDHNAQNEREVERLKLEHPKNEAKSVVKQDRLLGLLMPFLAFRRCQVQMEHVDSSEESDRIWPRPVE